MCFFFVKISYFPLYRKQNACPHTPIVITACGCSSASSPTGFLTSVGKFLAKSKDWVLGYAYLTLRLLLTHQTPSYRVQSTMKSPSGSRSIPALSALPVRSSKHVSVKMSFGIFLGGTHLESISHPAPFIQLLVVPPVCRSRAREDPKNCVRFGLILTYGCGYSCLICGHTDNQQWARTSRPAACPHPRTCK